MSADDVIRFKINGEDYEVGSEDAVDLTLEPFLFARGLRGTKLTCYEGGCGACTVVAAETDPNTGVKRTFPVHSCLASVYGCNGWEITTIEGLGNRFDGYNIIQDKLVETGGSQCGWCSPGMVMNMHGLTQGKASWTPEEVEQHLDGNLCRCTGYRPILDAFKSITPTDIEDMGKSKCGKKGGCCKSKQPSEQKSGCCKSKSSDQKPKKIVVNGQTWYQPTTLQELFSVMDSVEAPVTFVSGNTGHGVFWENSTTSYINLRAISELSAISSAGSAEGMKFGANVSITRVLEEFDAAASITGYNHTERMAVHWRHVGSVSLRNLGSWAGNLAMKNKHQEFQSDIFITLVAAQASVEIGSSDGSTEWVTVEEMLNVDLMDQKKVLLNLKLPPLGEETVYRSFKVTPRAVNCHAHVNAAFSIRVDASSEHTVIDTPILGFGAISSSFVRATATEDYLSGKSLKDPDVLDNAIQMLGSEIIPEEFSGEASPQYRKSLCQSLFYRTILGIVPEIVSNEMKTGADDLVRTLSSGIQVYDTDPVTYPISEPVKKLEAYTQVSGEARYTKEMIEHPDELHAFFVQSTRSNAAIDKIDPSKALAMEGIVGFIGVDDITGVNDIQVMSDPVNSEPLFPTTRTGYYGQPLGIIVADDQNKARVAAGLVEVTYSDEQRPILTVEEALQNPLLPNQPAPVIIGDVDSGFNESTTIVTGTMTRNGQYHFPMENQSVRVVPLEDGYDVFAATQWPAEAQASVAQVLGIHASSVNLSVKRLGGAFGSKIDRCNILTTATALAAQKFRKPVRTVLDFSVNMSMIGWRDPYLGTYKAGVDDNGILKAVEVTLTSDSGYVPVDSSSPLAAMSFPSCYQCSNWKIVPQFVVTNTACNTWCRTPGTVDGIAYMETVIDHLATELGEDKLEFRKKNFIPDGIDVSVSMGAIDLSKSGRIVKPVKRSAEKPKTILPVNLINAMVAQLEQDADVAARKTEVEDFNASNRWHKKGIAVQPMLWPYDYPAVGGFNVILSVYGADGTVSVAHGGIECGQGINTKVAQVAAYELGCPMEMVSIKPTNTLTGANSLPNSGSLGSYSNVYCVKQAAQKLRARLDAYGGSTWKETVQIAMANGADLTERHWSSGELSSFGVFGVACSEVILDVLTGKFIVLRTDILEDAGNLTSPLLDVGQIEGGFTMGQGLFTTEKPLYDPETGRRISSTTWFYYPLSALDIPVDFRVSFVKNAPNPIGVYSSKVVSEPGVCLSYSIPMALRNAVESARKDAGQTGWFRMDCPLTVENLQSLCLVDPTQFKFA